VKNLTLIIPAKNEPDSLPVVLEEIKNFDCNIIIILESTDTKTINAAKNFNCKLVYQTGKGFGNALIDGIKNVQTEYLCTFFADGSCDPKYLKEMLNLCNEDRDFIFASRYLKSARSDDDTIITKIGNFFFSAFGNIFFSIKLSDILCTYVVGKTQSFKKLDLDSSDFCICVEIPIKAKKMKMNYIDTPVHERKRIAGKKKVNEFVDGFKILTYMIKSFLK